MSQYNIVKTDILIIGAGLAGLNAAYEAALLGSEVTVICKGSASASPEVMGFNAPIHPDDSQELFYEEIMKSGQMLNRSGLAHRLAHESMEQVYRMEKLGVPFAKNPDGTAIVPEVCIFFENHLMRGNRTTKINAENFNAFRSFNYPPLARVGIHIKYEPNLIRKPDPTKPLKPHYLFDNNVVILTLFPGIQESIVTSLLHVPGLKAVVMKTFGSGNAPQKEWFIRQLKEATERGIIIVNITQCASGAVEMGRYETGMHLLEAGVISGYDSTPECAITKLMFLLGHGLPNKDIRYKMNSCLIGEITKS